MPNFLAPITQGGVDVALAGHTHTWTIPRGTAFPGSPGTGDLYQRSDLGEICEWDGNRWLSPIRDVSMCVWTAGEPWSSAVVSHGLPLNFSFLMRAYTVSWFNSGTNNASNYWTMALLRDATTISTLSTAAANGSGLSGVLVDNNPYVLSAGTLVQLQLSKIGSPGAIRFAPMITYRRVYT